MGGDFLGPITRIFLLYTFITYKMYVAPDHLARPVCSFLRWPYVIMGRHRTLQQHAHRMHTVYVPPYNIIIAQYARVPSIYYCVRTAPPRAVIILFKTMWKIKRRMPRPRLTQWCSDGGVVFGRGVPHSPVPQTRRLNNKSKANRLTLPAFTFFFPFQFAPLYTEIIYLHYE